MGAIEDIRKVMQDFLAPELRAMTERLNALDTSLKELRTNMREGFEKAEQRNETRYQELVRNLNLEGRMEKLETSSEKYQRMFEQAQKSVKEANRKRKES